MLIEKLPLTENTSFVAETFRTPYFEVPWHQHVEYELILFTEGEGLGFIGNHTGEFKTGDIFFIGKNVPHTFQKRQRDLITSAVVVQFREDFWGDDFMKLPELAALRDLFVVSMQGLKINGRTKALLNPIVKELERLKGLKRVMNLLECLRLIYDRKEYSTLSTQEVKLSNPKDMERIDKVFGYSSRCFQQKITLAEVADIAGMSVPAFCNYFKKSTKKTYIDFLNEIRIGYACKLLTTTDKSIMNICYESGFNTLANFNKQFMRIKSLTPSKYRKMFVNSLGAGESG